MRRAFALCLIAACGGGAAESRPTAPQPVQVEPAKTPSPAPRTNVLSRADLDAVLDAGVGAFLAKVELEPQMDAGHFVGFRIVSFADPRFEGANIHAGDVVLSVNGLRIEHPEDLARVWQELRVASELAVDVLRAGHPERVSYSIE